MGIGGYILPAWQEELADLAMHEDGWFDSDSPKGGWGKKINDEDICMARKLLAAVSEQASSVAVFLEGDPLDGSVCMMFLQRERQRLTVYTDSDTATYMLISSVPGRGFLIDRDEVSFDETVETIVEWFGEEPKEGKGQGGECH